MGGNILNLLNIPNINILLKPILLAMVTSALVLTSSSRVFAQTKEQAVDLRLVGTSFLDPLAPLVILESVQSGKQETFQIGDSVFDVGRLKSITKRGVIIERKDLSSIELTLTGGKPIDVISLAKNQSASSEKTPSKKRTLPLQELASVIVPPQVLEGHPKNLSPDKLQELVDEYRDSPVALGRDPDGSLYYDMADRPILFTPERLFGDAGDFSFEDSGQISTSGLLITNVHKSTIISPLGLEPGDLIVRVGGVPLKSYDDFKKAIARSSGASIGVEYMRAGERRGKEIRFLNQK